MAHFKAPLLASVHSIEASLLPEGRTVRWLYAGVVWVAGRFVHPLLPVASLTAAAMAVAVAGYWSAVWWLVTPLLFAVVAASIPFRREIAGIARSSGLPPGKVLLMQYVYEFVSACTSVVVRDSHTSAPVHLRVMDWTMPGMDLQSLVCEVNFIRSGRSVALDCAVWLACCCCTATQLARSARDIGVAASSDASSSWCVCLPHTQHQQQPQTPLCGHYMGGTCRRVHGHEVPAEWRTGNSTSGTREGGGGRGGNKDYED